MLWALLGFLVIATAAVTDGWESRLSRMAPEERERLFKRFVTLAQSYEKKETLIGYQSALLEYQRALFIHPSDRISRLGAAYGYFLIALSNSDPVIRGDFARRSLQEAQGVLDSGGDFAGAAAFLRAATLLRSVDRQPDDPPSGVIDRVFSILNRAGGREREEAEELRARWLIYQGAGELQEGLDRFKRLSMNHPDQPSIQLGLVMAYRRQKVESAVRGVCAKLNQVKRRPVRYEQQLYRSEAELICNQLAMMPD